MTPGLSVLPPSCQRRPIPMRRTAASVLLPIDEAEDIVLANAGEFVRMRRQGRTAYKAGRTTRLRDLR